MNFPIDFLNGQPNPLPTLASNYPEWHRGRSRFAVWLVLLEQEVLRLYCAQLRHALGDLLWPAAQRALHVTVQAVGFPALFPRFDDDVSPAQLQVQAASLAGLPPFMLEVGAINSFHSALYLSVTDSEDGLAQARARLAQGAPEVAGGGYVPHVTLGVYRPEAQALSAQVLWRRLQALPLLPPLRVRVRELVLAEYDSGVLHGALSVRQRVALQ